MRLIFLVPTICVLEQKKRRKKRQLMYCHVYPLSIYKSGVREGGGGLNYMGLLA